MDKPSEKDQASIISGQIAMTKYSLPLYKLLEFMKQGLTAKTESGNIIYNTDYAEDEIDTLDPSLEERREAERSFTINQMRIQRGQPSAYDGKSIFPEGYCGISFSMPNGEKEVKAFKQKICELYFSKADVERMLGSVPNKETTEEIDYYNAKLKDYTKIKSDPTPEKIVNDKTDRGFFPRLHIHNLKNQAQRWVKKYKEAPIQRVLLYGFSSPYEGYMLEQGLTSKPLPIKYAVVFEVDADDETVGMSEKEMEEFRHAKMMDKRSLFPGERLQDATGEYNTVPDKVPHLNFITADFKRVYKQSPLSTFRNEWIFRVKFNNKDLNPGIKIDEFFELLWEQNQQENKFSKKSVTHSPLKGEQKSDENMLDDLLEKLDPDVEIFYEAMKRIVKARKNIMHDLTPEIAISAHSSVLEQLKYIKENDINQGIDYGQVETPSRDIKGQLLRNLIFRINPRLYSNRNLSVTNYQALGKRYRKVAKNLASK